MVLTIEERVFLVGHVLHNGEKYMENLQQKFTQQFPDAQVRHHNAVQNVINKFREMGSAQDAPRSHRLSTSEDTVLNIQDRMLQSPSKSVKWLSQQAHMSKSTAHRILRTKLKFHPYRTSVVHQLKERDHQSRVDYCIWFQNFPVEEGEEILDVTFFTDEAWFHLSEYVNSQNTHL
jgi:AraC-like DNA-binding protein